MFSPVLIVEILVIDSPFSVPTSPLSHRDQKRVRVLENYCGLSTRNKAQVDRAMQSFIEMLDQGQDYLPAVLGMATGFMIEKNQVRDSCDC